MSEELYQSDCSAYPFLFLGASLIPLVALSPVTLGAESDYSPYLSNQSYVTGHAQVSNSSYQHHLPLYHKLYEIECLETNWDGYGASAFTSEAISAAKTFLGGVKDSISNLYIFPTMRDSIQFEWEQGDIYAEIEVFESKFELYAESDGEEIQSLSSSDMKSMQDAFIGLYNRSRS